MAAFDTSIFNISASNCRINMIFGPILGFKDQGIQINAFQGCRNIENIQGSYLTGPWCTDNGMNEHGGTMTFSPSTLNSFLNPINTIH